jgi:ribonuclease HI
MPKPKEKFYYAVAIGKNVGVFDTWPECSLAVKGCYRAKYRKFPTREEAEQFVEEFRLPAAANKAATSAAKRASPRPPAEPLPDPDYYVYTDGSCIHNGRKNAAAGYGIYFGENDPRNISARITGKQTNNIAELTAIIHTYRIIEPDIIAGKQIAIVTDSEYCIKCLTTYGKRCHKANWETDMPNRELVKEAYTLYMDKPNVRFIHIMAHTNNSDIHSIGNDHADKLANAAIGLTQCPYSHLAFVKSSLAENT